MAQDTRICRLCLKLIQNDVPYSPIRTNNNVLHNLNLVFFDTTKNLELTENPIICNSCDITLQEIATFKEHIISNESQITMQSIQNNDLSTFLKAISKDVDSICRLCLNHFEDVTLLQKSLIECNAVITKCNINLNLDIPSPSKICIQCDQGLQNMLKFVLKFSDNEAKIDDLAKEKKKLTNKDLHDIQSITSKRAQETNLNRDNNNVLPKEKEYEKKTNDINDAKKSIKTTAGAKSIKIQSTIISFTKIKSVKSTKVSEKDENTFSFTQNNHLKAADSEALILRKSPKTYTRILKNKKSHLKHCFPLNVRFRTQNEPSTSKSSDSDTIIITNENDVSIDTLPVEDLADITLEMSLQMQHHGTDTVSADNVTLELIDLMEETEFLTQNGHGVNYQYKTAEELLKVLEDSADESIDDINKPNGHINEKEETVQEQNKRKKTTELKPIPKKGKNVVKKKNISVTNVQINGSGTEGSGQKRHNLRQKSIVTSFRDMLNMKPLKKISNENSENPKVEASHYKDKGECAKEGKSVKRKPIKGSSIGKIKNQEQENNNNVEEKKKKIAPRKATKATDNKAIDAEKKADPKTGIKERILEEMPSTSSLFLSDKQKNIVDEKNSIVPRVKKPTEKGNENALANSDTTMNEGENQSENKKILKKYGKKSNLQGQERIVAKGLEEKLDKQKKLKDGLQVRKENDVEMLERENTEISKSNLEEKIVNKTIKEVIVNKRTKRKTNSKEIEKEIPKKRPKKIAQKTLNAAEQIQENTTSKNDTQLAATESDGEDADSEDSDRVNRSVVVMIRRQKRTNKSVRDKTWSELTGKEIKEEKDLEPPKVPKKRGRPPLPENLRKEKKPKPVYYLCKFCSFKSISPHIITQHEFIHNIVEDVAVYKCSQCTFRSNNQEILAQHKEAHLTLDLMYKCMFCDFSAKKKTKTMYHMLRHDDQDVASLFYCLVINRQTDEEYYECFQCNYETPEESIMPDHVIEHQMEKIKNPTVAKFSCKECSYKTKFEDMFKRHNEGHERKKEMLAKRKIKKEVPEIIKTEPGDESQTESQTEGQPETVYSCDLCRYLTYNKRSLANHKGLKHNRAPPNAEKEVIKKPEPEQIYKCHECSYTTPKKPHLSRHLLVHRSKENMEFLECPHCYFETKHRRSYTRHMEMRHKVFV